MISDVLLEILLAVFEKEVEIVGSFLDVKELDNVRMPKILKSFVLFLNAFDKIGEIVLE